MTLLLKSPHLSDKGLRETKLEWTLKCLPWGTALRILEILGNLPRNKNQSIVLPAVTSMSYNGHHRRCSKGTIVALLYLKGNQEMSYWTWSLLYRRKFIPGVVHDWWGHETRSKSTATIFTLQFLTELFVFLVLRFFLYIQRLTIFQI